MFSIILWSSHFTNESLLRESVASFWLPAWEYKAAFRRAFRLVLVVPPGAGLPFSHLMWPISRD
jgi:hypothetical protein